MDKRKSNGGNSTKTKGIDKRKNAYRDAVEEAISPQDIINILHKFRDDYLATGDIQAGKTVLEYCVTKPTENKDFTTNGNDIVANVVISDELAKELSDNIE